MTDVFISFSREDLEKVRPLADAIVGAGYRVFGDRQTPADLTWPQPSDKALDEARCVVVLWSRSSTSSERVIEEAEHGRRRWALIQIIIEDVMPPPAFRLLPRVDLRAWDGDPYHPQIQEFLASIKRITGTPLPKARDSLPKEKGAALPPAKSSPPEQPVRQRQARQGHPPGISAKPGAMLFILAFAAAADYPVDTAAANDQRARGCPAARHGGQVISRGW